MQDILTTMALDRQSGLPLHDQIRTGIERLIANGRFKPGDRIPGDVELAALLGVHHRTVRRGLGELARRGLIVRRRRAGTFVADPTQQPRPSIGFFYFAENEGAMLVRAQQIQRLLQPIGYDLKTVGYDADWFETADLPTLMRQMRLSAALLVPLAGDACRHTLRLIRESDFPLVLFGNTFHADLGFPCVSGNDPLAMRTLLVRLWTLGHRHIGFLCWAGATYDEVVEGFQGFFRAQGAPASAGRVIRYDKLEVATGRPEALARLRHWLAARRDATALVAYDAAATRLVLDVARQQKRQIPRDLSLFTIFGGAEPADWRPPIGTMTLSPDPLSAAAVGLLLMRMTANRSDRELPDWIRVNWEMNERASLAPPPSHERD